MVGRDRHADGVASAAVPAAVAIELVHNFSLLHDDVIDGDVTRRHRPTAWSVFGRSAAILAGDSLLTLAFDVLAASGHPDSREGMRILSAAVQSLVEGQSLDVAFEDRQDIELAECEVMARGKTGALISAACAIGALFGGARSGQVEHMRAFGAELGLAFQLVDDLLGIWGDPAVTGKPVYSDLHNRKKSLPVVAALRSKTTAAQELHELYHADWPLSGVDVERAAALIDACLLYTQSLPGHPSRPLSSLVGFLTGPETHEQIRGAAMQVKVLLASPRSFCAGVERAIEIVEEVLRHRKPPVYVRKQIVHNKHVVADLATRGAVFVDELDAVPDGATVVFSAHGVSPAVREEAERRQLDVIDATCPLVTKVHTEARRFAGRGDTVVLVGHAGHEEVEGTLGEAPDRTVLVESAEDVASLDIPDPSRVSYLMQTTLAVDEAAEVVSALRARFPDLRGPASDDICYATTNRQNALHAIADEADLVLVVGSTNSSNSVRLVELAQRHGTPAYLIDDVSDIKARWLEGVRVIGITAGASAPPGLVDEVVAALNPISVENRETVTETIQFTLPPAARRSS